VATSLNSLSENLPRPPQCPQRTSHDKSNPIAKYPENAIWDSVVSCSLRSKDLAEEGSEKKRKEGSGEEEKKGEKEKKGPIAVKKDVRKPKGPKGLQPAGHKTLKEVKKSIIENHLVNKAQNC